VSSPPAEHADSPEPAGSRRRQTAAGVVGLGVLAVVAGLIWLQRPASWPPELDDPVAESLFSSSEQPTADDLALLSELITDIALDDPVVVGMLADREWPEPDIRPVYWTAAGPDGSSVLIGGSFELDLDGADYTGPWPTAGCRRGSYRGTVRTVDADALEWVSLTVDLTFERVTHVVVPPGEPGSAAIVYRDDYETAPWYTGRCPYFGLPD
jgi:hypothetical protein